MNCVLFLSHRMQNSLLPLIYTPHIKPKSISPLPSRRKCSSPPKLHWWIGVSGSGKVSLPPEGACRRGKAEYFLRSINRPGQILVPPLTLHSPKSQLYSPPATSRSTPPTTPTSLSTSTSHPATARRTAGCPPQRVPET